MKMNRRNLVTIVTLLVLLVGSVSVLAFATKTLRISRDLFIIHDNIKCYNESPRKTVEWEQEIREQMQYRKENFYQSEDLWTRTFSNMYGIMKAFIAIAMVFVYPVIIYMWLYVIAFLIERHQRRMKRKSKRRTR